MKDKKVVKLKPRDLSTALIEVAPVKTAIFVVTLIVGFVSKLCGFVDVGLVASFIALGMGVALYRQRQKILAVMEKNKRNLARQRTTAHS